MQMKQLCRLLSLIAVFALAHGLARAEEPKPVDRGLTLQDWFNVLLDPDQPSRYRREAREVIDRHRTDLNPFIDQLIELLGDDDYGFFAQRLLAQIGPSTVEPLTKLLDHESPRLRAAAASALGDIGAEGKAAIPRLVELLEDESTFSESWSPQPRRVNSDASPALAAMGSESLPALRRAVFHQSAIVRREAVCALCLMGEDARAAVDDIAAMCGDSDADAALHAVVALSHITQDEQYIAPALVRALRHRSETVRSYANRYLGKHVRTNSNAIVALVDVLRTDKSADMRGSAAETLGTVQASPSVVSALAKAVGDSEKYYVTIGCTGFESSVDTAAIQALTNLGSRAMPAIPKLLELLKTETEADGVRGRQILKAIAAMGKAGEEAVPMLETLLWMPPSL